MGPKDFGSKQILGPINIWKKCWVQKICEKSFGLKKYLKKILVPKNFGSKKILVQKKVLSERNKVPKKFWVKFCVQKNCGSKEFESEKNFESKIFGPPPPLPTA